MIATTNHIETLDAALIRPGRIDLCLELGYLTMPCFQEMLARFFPEGSPGLSDRVMNTEISAAQVQEAILLGAEAKELVEEFTCIRSSAIAAA